MIKTKITAHAGCMGTLEDSLEAVKAAVRVKADICEVDVSALSDGTPVLKHDLVKLTDTGLIKLSEVFEYVKDKDILLNLDVKDKSALKEITRLTEYYGLGKQVFLTGINEKEAILLSNTGFKVNFYLNHDLQPCLLNVDYDSYLNKLIETMKSLECIGLNSYYRFCTNTAVQKIHDAGLLMSVWTVDDSKNMKKLTEMGVDNITTRHPDLLLDVLSREVFD